MAAEVDRERVDFLWCHLVSDRAHAFEEIVMTRRGREVFELLFDIASWVPDEEWPCCREIIRQFRATRRSWHNTPRSVLTTAALASMILKRHGQSDLTDVRNFTRRSRGDGVLSEAEP